MQENESPADEGSPIDQRRAHLTAAAQAVVAWVHAQRATWSSHPVDTASSPRDIAGSVVYDEPAYADPAPPKVRPAKPLVRLRVPTAVRFLRQPLIRWSRRVAIAAAAVAIVAVLVMAGLGAYRYWLTVAATRETGTAVQESVPAVKLTGRLEVQSEPPGARVLIDGQARGVTPLAVDDLSVGSHAVVFESDAGSVRRTVVVTSDGTAQIAESIYPGWLKVFAPFEVQIAEGTRAMRPDDRNQIILSPGPHDLRFENRALGYAETRRVEVEPGRVTSLSLVPPSSTLTVTATLPAEVFIDGARVGETPLTDQPVSLGTRDVIVRSAAGVERRFTTTVTVAPVRINVDFSQP